MSTDPQAHGDEDGLSGRYRRATRAVRARPGGDTLLKGIALVVGALFVALGLALIVLPGPLTIPPILLGLYVLSLEFAWAMRLRERAEASAREAWETAKQSPVKTAVLSVGGLLLAGAGIWAVLRYDLLTRGRDALGL